MKSFLVLSLLLNSASSMGNYQEMKLTTSYVRSKEDNYRKDEEDNDGYDVDEFNDEYKGDNLDDDSKVSDTSW